jgi:hypothetical protein
MADKKEKSKRAVNPNLRPWKKGQSGNPKGRPTREMQCRELLAQIGEHGDEALAIIAEVMRNPRAGDAEEIRLKAANSILDRIIGKPTQSVAASILQRNIPADGTLIEGSTMMSHESFVGSGAGSLRRKGNETDRVPPGSARAGVWARIRKGRQVVALGLA